MIMISLLLRFTILAWVLSRYAVTAFAPASRGGCSFVPATRRRPNVPRLAALSTDDTDENDAGSADSLIAGSLPPPPPAALEIDNGDSEQSATPPSNGGSTGGGSVAMMMSRENRRVLIEELGYKRVDVQRLKVDMVPSIVQKRIKCPDDGVPESWCLTAEELQEQEQLMQQAEESQMMERLKKESQYPLKFPLLGISLILFGKGFGDALITIIKVNIDFPGATLNEEFLGIPVLLIDAVCVILGAAIGSWTWKNMS